MLFTFFPAAPRTTLQLTLHRSPQLSSPFPATSTMRLLSIFVGLVVAVLLPVLASPVPGGEQGGEEELVMKFERYFSGNDTDTTETSDGKLAKRDTCYSNGQFGGPWSKAHAQKLANNLQTINPWNYWFLNQGGGGITWTYGTARICVKNSYIWQSTYVSEWEVGWALNYILGACPCVYSDNTQW